MDGRRYTADELNYNHGRIASAAGVPGVGATRATVLGGTTKSKVSGRFGPQFEITKDVMAYATYSRGYKGPAFNVFFNKFAHCHVGQLRLGPSPRKARASGL